MERGPGELEMGQLTLPFEHRVAHGVDSFLVGSGNRHAVDWIDRWPDWPFTALVVTGQPGCGKTHLASLWRARTGAETIDLGSAEIEQVVAAADSGRSVVVDDCDRAMEGGKAERALLQLYNLVRTGGGRLLLTACRSPSQWNLELPDLASRLNSAMVVTIDPPDDVLLASIALKLFADRQITVNEGVISFLLNRGERTVVGLARAIEVLDRAAFAMKRPITVALARDVLAALEDADGT
jgi:DnaA regulatory inactivator Hda